MGGREEVMSLTMRESGRRWPADMRESACLPVMVVHPAWRRGEVYVSLGFLFSILQVKTSKMIVMWYDAMRWRHEDLKEHSRGKL